MKQSFKPFTCPECGGTVRMAKPTGETREFARGVSARIPENILIPKCDRCGELYLNAEDAKRIDTALRKARLESPRVRRPKGHQRHREP